MLESMLALYRLLRFPLPLDDLLQHVLTTALACVPNAQRGSLTVGEGEYLYYRASIGYDLERLRAVRYSLAYMRDVFLAGEQIAQIEDFSERDKAHLDAESIRILTEHGGSILIRRSLVISIQVSGNFYGMLFLDNLRSHRPFPPEAVTLAALFAEQAGMLIEQALLLDQLRQTRTVLVEAEKMASLGRFVANIAHEINNPLTTVLGYAELLTASPLDEESREMLARLHGGAERVRAIVQGLQIFARQQHSGQGAVDLNLLIDQTLKLKQIDFAHSEILAECDLAPDLPKIWLDGGQISQVLLNLLVNAQYALRERLPPRRLVITSRFARLTPSGTPQIVITVSDNGLGIPPEISGRIFEPFFTTKPVGEGTGLGLSICYGIVTQLGGRIVASQTPGGGATFTVELPMQPPSQEAVPQLPTRAMRVLAGLHVLVLDDDRDVMQVVQRMLEPENQVATVTRGEEGLRLAATESFDLLLCDLKMPGMSGVEFYRQLQERAPAMAERLIFMSGDTSSSQSYDFLLSSGRPLLSKPFTLKELEQAALKAKGKK
jgi:signal transduction histidine kinase/ActR/RegA family two-component response regulator